MLSIIIPTYNEKENLPVLVEKIFSCLDAKSTEVIIVDDNSPDKTGDIAENLKKRFPIQVIHRSGKKGLASAVIEGFQKANGNFLGVMDADLSHDPNILPLMKNRLSNGIDLAVGSRHVSGGGTKGWPKFREFGSHVAIALARPITTVRDATSGYFCFKRSIISGVDLDPLGFKIGLEIFVKGLYSKFEEVPYVFHDRKAGKSKFNQKEVFNYIKHLGRLYRWQMSKIFSQLKKRPA